MSKVEVYTEYKCKKGHKWFKWWSRVPWFRDWSQPCPECKRGSYWPHYKFEQGTK